MFSGIFPRRRSAIDVGLGVKTIRAIVDQGSRAQEGGHDLLERLRGSPYLGRCCHFVVDAAAITTEVINGAREVVSAVGVGTLLVEGRSAGSGARRGEIGDTVILVALRNQAVDRVFVILLIFLCDLGDGAVLRCDAAAGRTGG